MTLFGEKIIMKRQYKTPSLTVHGNVETLTKAIGFDSRRDGVFVNGNPVDDGPATDGSGDLKL